MNLKKVVFIHYRTGERDGVSLEIEKRAKVLNALGCEVFYITGFDGYNRSTACEIPEIDIKNLEAIALRKEIFGGSKSEKEVFNRYFELEDKIIEGLEIAFDKIRPDLIFVHNIFSLGLNLPVSTALLRIMDERKIPTVCIHHDFWFERDELTNPHFLLVRDILGSLPSRRNYILKHQVINSLAQKELKKRRGIEAERIGDYFSFPEKYEHPYQKKQIAEKIKNDLGINENSLVILQPTRIIPRKGIENAILFASLIQQKIKNSFPILNGRKISEVALLFPNFVEIGANSYKIKLQELADNLNVRLIWAEEYFTPMGNINYDFFDSYLLCDIMTYPSLKEGFGNQFLEAVFFRKLPVVFEYDIFKSDIEKEGYSYISLGDKTYEKDGLKFVPIEKINEAVRNAIEILSNPNKLEEITDQNFKIGRKNHSESLLLKDLEEVIRQVEFPIPTMLTL